MSGEGHDSGSEKVEKIALPEDILSLLGEPKKCGLKLGDPVHIDIAARWDGILKQGLDTETKNALISKYPPVANCSSMQAPKINPEVKGAATEAALRRDDRLVEKQNQITACLSAVGKILTSLLEKSGQGVEDRHLIELAGDTGRLLADMHFSESESRRILVGASLNKKFKGAMGDAPPDEWLFGSDLGERLKTAKSLERSTLELKGEKLPTLSTKPKGNLNFKRPSNNKVPQKRFLRMDGQNHTQLRGGNHPRYSHQGQRERVHQNKQQTGPRRQQPVSRRRY